MNNQVSPALSLIGTNNSGGPGSYGIEISSGTPPPIVTATAVNFNGQSNSITVTFVSTYPPPAILHSQLHPTMDTLMLDNQRH